MADVLQQPLLVRAVRLVERLQQRAAAPDEHDHDLAARVEAVLARQVAALERLNWLTTDASADPLFRTTTQLADQLQRLADQFEQVDLAQPDLSLSCAAAKEVWAAAARLDAAAGQLLIRLYDAELDLRPVPDSSEEGPVPQNVLW